MRTAVLLLGALAACLVLTAAASATVRGPFHPDGQWLKDPYGRVVIVHGLQVAHKAKPYHPDATQLNGADARRIRGLGFNAVRLAWLWAGVEPKRGRYSTAYVKEIARETKVFTRNRIAVLLSSHQDVFSRKLRGDGFPDWAAITGGKGVGPKRTYINYRFPGIEHAFAMLFLNRKGIATSFAKAWAKVAGAVRSERSMLLGYDLFNEPWPGRSYADCNRGGCRSFDRTYTGPLQTKLARAVRTQDRKTLVWYEPHLLFDFGLPSFLRRAPKDVRPAAFTFHAYCRKATGGAGARPNHESESPGYSGCPAEDDAVFGNAHRTAKAVGGPPLFGEFGDTTDPVHVERLMQRADRERMGWLFWSYKDWVDVPGGGGDGSLFDDDDDLDTFRGAQADLLARAYPEATAGEPVSWSWDKAQKRFDFTYRPNPTIPKPTVVSLPVQRHYPNGYKVTVTGGTRVSAPGAASLELNPQAGAREVRVTVVPG